MKKFLLSLISLLFLIIIGACSGYKPIFGTSNLKFKIADYSITGDKKLGNQIYSRLNSLSKSNENSPEAIDVFILIQTSKNKNATAKNTAGKILGYRINLSASITIKDVMTGNKILNENFSYASTYKTQDQYFNTVKIENQTTKDLIENLYQDLLIKLSANLL